MYRIYLVLDDGKKLVYTCSGAEERDKKIKDLLNRISDERTFVEYEEFDDKQ